jgi:tight adherence protein C
VIWTELAFGVLAAVGVAVATGLWRIGAPVEDKYAAKLARVGDHTLSLEELELSLPFKDRFLIPLRDAVGSFMLSLQPANRQEQMRKTIVAAGNPYRLSVAAVLVAKAIMAALGAGLGAFVFLPFVGVTFPVSLVGAGLGLAGWVVPDAWLKQQGAKRRRAVERAIPDTLDLLTICLDAGLSFDAAMQRIAEKVEDPLKTELTIMLTDIRYGRSRQDALDGLAERVAAEDMTAFVNAVQQSQKLGVAIGDTVRIQAKDIRRRRRQRCEELAAQASLKMLFPMVGCIFPTLFVALMGPVAIILFNRH